MNKTIYVADERLWATAAEKAKELDLSMSALISTLLKEWVANTRAQECDACERPIEHGWEIPFGTDGRHHVYCHIGEYFDQKTGGMTCYCSDDMPRIAVEDYSH